MSDGITITINAATANAAAQLEKFFGQMTGGLNQLTQAGEFVRGMGAQIAAAFTLGAIVDEFKKAIDSAEEFGKTMQKTGLSLQTLSETKLLALSKDISFEQVSASLEIFNERLFMAQRLGGEAARPFLDLKIATDAASLAALTSEQAYRKVLDAMQAAPDAITREGIAWEFFGRSGRENIPWMAEGSAGLDKLHDAAAAAIDQATIDNATRFNTSLREMDEAFHQIFLDASKELLPILQDLVAWLKSTETSMNGEVTASEGLVIAFQSVASVIMAVKSGLVVLFQFIGDNWAATVEVLTGGIDGIVVQLRIWLDWIKNVTLSLWEMVKAVGESAKAMKDLVSGNISQAEKDMADAHDRLFSAGKKIGADTAQTWRDSGDSLLQSITTTWAKVASIGKQFWDSASNEATTYVNAINDLWQKHTPAAVGAQSRSGASAASLPGAGMVASLPAISEEGKKLIEEIDKDYRKATETKLLQLDAERDELLKKLDLEVADVAAREAEKQKVLEMYAAKRAELQRAAQQEQFQINAGTIGNRIEDVESDPLQTSLQKAQQLIPLYQQLAALNAAMAQQNLAVEYDPRASEDAKLTAKKEQVKLDQQALEIQTKLYDLQKQGSFSGNLQQGLTKMQEEWGNLQKNSANTALEAIQEGVKGVGTAIMDGIERTKTWGQVFLQVGRQIVQQIIEMAVQWVVQATIIQGLKEAFAIKDATTAATTAAAQAPAALMTSLATSGTSATLGLAAFLAAAASAVGFASGGVVHGGEQLIRVNESGTEAVLNARAVNYLGHNFINSVNAGAQANAGLHGAIMDGLTRPITETGWQGRAGAVNVQGHKMSVAFVNSRSEARDYLNTSEGEKHVVDIARRRRLDLGVQT